MMMATRPANTSGTQPPSASFRRLAARKVRSIAKNGAIRAAASSGDQPHTFQITTNAMAAVTTMVPVTEMP
jgi:hypothetical protein